MTTTDEVMQTARRAAMAAKGAAKKGKCKGCKGSVLWVTMPSGKPMPLEPEPIAGGNIVLEEDGPRVLSADEISPGRVAFVSHFVSCPFADELRKPKTKAAEPTEEPSVAAPTVDRPKSLAELPLSAITESPMNPRRHFDDEALHELARSIMEVGILQPVTVRPKVIAATTARPLQEYELVIGARRYRAAKLAELTHVPAIVSELSDEQALGVMLTENARRADISPLEEADAMARLRSQFGRTAAEIADRLGLTHKFVERRLRLVTLIAPLRELLQTQRIGVISGELLGALSAELQQQIAENMARHNYGTPITWNVDSVRRAIENYTRRLCDAPWDLQQQFGMHGACRGCLLTSASQGDMFAPHVLERCLDSACWADKRERWLADAIDNGAIVLEGAQATKALDSSRQPGRSEYMRVKTVLGESSGVVGPVRELVPAAPLVIALDEHGAAIAMVRTADVADALEKTHPLAAKAARDLLDKATDVRNYDKEQREKEKKIRADHNLLLLELEETVEEIVANAPARTLAPWVELLVRAALAVVGKDVRTAICKRRELEIPKRGTWTDPNSALLTEIAGMNSTGRVALLTELILFDVARTAVSGVADAYLSDEARMLLALVRPPEVQEDAEAVDYAKMPVKALRALLGERGLSITGTKAELVKRLLEVA